MRRERKIFWAKTAAGVMVYLSGACIPLLGLVAWAERPGHLAVPYEWQMASRRLSYYQSDISKP